MSELYVFVGPGGVGKTTCAAALGATLAKQGKKVVVFTVDPAKRLAQALGLEKLESDAKKVAGIEGPGELWALWLDPTTAFESLVKRLSSKPETQKRVLEHRLFKIIQEQLGGIEEYLGVEKLLSLKKENTFDVFILDTPPSQHSLDFLESPNHLLKFLDEGVIRFFLSPDSSEKKKNFLTRFMSGTKEQAFEVFKSFLGQTFLAELADLLENLKPVRDELVSTANQLNSWIRSERTHFFLVTQPEPYPLREIQYLRGELELRFPATTSSLVLNRFIPPVEGFLTETTGEISNPILRSLKNRMKMHQEIREKVFKGDFPKNVVVLSRQSLFAESNVHSLTTLGEELLGQWANPQPKITSEN